MKRIKIITVLALSCLMLGCSNINTSSSQQESLSTQNVSQTSVTSSQEESSSFASSEEESEESYSHTYIVIEHFDDKAVTFTKLLDRPNMVVHSFKQLCSIVDYYAFYSISEFQVKLASDYVYFTGSENDIDKEMNAVYWGESLVNGVMGMSHTFENNVLTVNFTQYDTNHIYCEPTSTNFNNLAYTQGNYNSNLTFASDDEEKPVCQVYDSQQLYYAVENGYKIEAIENSPAEEMYSYCKTLLNKIISPTMDYLDKVYAIYDYIENNCVYDYAALDEPEPDNPKLFPDQYAAQYQCFYLEGCLYNHVCVCDGYAKTFSLLSNMVGIDCFRACGTSDRRWETREVSGHAYCMVLVDDEYYLVCPTWGQSRCNIGTTEDVYKTITYSSYLLTTIDYSASFYQYASINYMHDNIATGYSDHFAKIQEMRKQRFENMSITYNEEKISLNITSSSQLQKVIDAVKENKGSSCSVYLSSTFDYEKYDNVKIYKINETNGVYEYLICNIEI